MCVIGGLGLALSRRWRSGQALIGGLPASSRTLASRVRNEAAPGYSAARRCGVLKNHEQFKTLERNRPQAAKLIGPVALERLPVCRSLTCGAIVPSAVLASARRVPPRSHHGHRPQFFRPAPGRSSLLAGPARNPRSNYFLKKTFGAGTARQIAPGPTQAATIEFHRVLKGSNGMPALAALFGSPTLHSLK